MKSLFRVFILKFTYISKTINPESETLNRNPQYAPPGNIMCALLIIQKLGLI
jgi:hypothetical protein